MDELNTTLFEILSVGMFSFVMLWPQLWRSLHLQQGVCLLASKWEFLLLCVISCVTTLGAQSEVALKVIFADTAVLQSVLFLILVSSVALQLGPLVVAHRRRVFRDSGSLEVCFVCLLTRTPFRPVTCSSSAPVSQVQKFIVMVNVPFVSQRPPRWVCELKCVLPVLSCSLWAVASTGSGGSVCRESCTFQQLLSANPVNIRMSGVMGRSGGAVGNVAWSWGRGRHRKRCMETNTSSACVFLLVLPVGIFLLYFQMPLVSVSCLFFVV